MTNAAFPDGLAASSLAICALVSWSLIIEIFQMRLEVILPKVPEGLSAVLAVEGSGPFQITRVDCDVLWCHSISQVEEVFRPAGSGLFLCSEPSMAD